MDQSLRDDAHADGIHRQTPYAKCGSPRASKLAATRPSLLEREPHRLFGLLVISGIERILHRFQKASSQLFVRIENDPDESPPAILM
jgi:hypothetical protein